MPDPNTVYYSNEVDEGWWPIASCEHAAHAEEIAQSLSETDDTCDYGWTDSNGDFHSVE